MPAAGLAGAEGEPEERERRVLVRAASVAVLAVHDPGLVRVQSQPDLDHPVLDRRPYRLRLLLADAMHDRVVGVALERDARETLGHPRVERVVHEQVCQHRRDYAPNAMDNFCFDVNLGYRRLERPRRPGKS
ncbi:hypothetical protein GCM10023170_092320 [Phytohabitans houttuyneae]|uniref:Uncharacterized protein n=1 Tax=Phytohabitans houttuyneae TaxID=1076126 RepID=A0A6V8K9B0_9ACTN|nr:hypothetical protein Phou_015050 [Phytohabitans houttuyneae]